jgi:hypothetical protein
MVPDNVTGHLSEIYITKPDAQVGQNCLRALTAKLLQLQQLIFKARTRLLFERDRGRHLTRTRQLQLPRMTHPAPNPRQPKCSRSITFITSTINHVQWLKKIKHHSTTDHLSTPLHRITPTLQLRLRSTPAITLDPNTTHAHPLLTPQPPLLTTPHCTALHKHHGPSRPVLLICTHDHHPNPL